MSLGSQKRKFKLFFLLTTGLIVIGLILGYFVITNVGVINPDIQSNKPYELSMLANINGKLDGEVDVKDLKIMAFFNWREATESEKNEIKSLLNNYFKNRIRLSDFGDGFKEDISCDFYLIVKEMGKIRIDSKDCKRNFGNSEEKINFKNVVLDPNNSNLSNVAKISTAEWFALWIPGLSLPLCLDFCTKKIVTKGKELKATSFDKFLNVYSMIITKEILNIPQDRIKSKRITNDIKLNVMDMTFKDIVLNLQGKGLIEFEIQEGESIYNINVVIEPRGKITYDRRKKFFKLYDFNNKHTINITVKLENADLTLTLLPVKFTGSVSTKLNVDETIRIKNSI